MRRKKRFIPTLLLTVLSWGGFGYVLFNVSPMGFVSKILFFALLFFALFLSIALLLNNTRRGFLIALGILVLALLRFFELFHPLYIVLVVALLLTVELYFLKK